MLTPLEIENQKFSKQMMNGYNVQEIDDFLDKVTVDYEKLYKENSELKQQVEEGNNNLTRYKTIEDTLQNTLVIAQSTAEQVKNVAEKKAEQIISEAQATALKSGEEIEQKMTMKIYEFNELKKKFDTYKAKMEALLISQLELLKEQIEDIN